MRHLFAVLVVIGGLASVTCAEAAEPLPASGAVISLHDVNPIKAEYGMVKDPNALSKMEGDGAFDVSGWEGILNARGFWPDKQKVVKAVDPALSIEDGEHYLSERTDGFAVSGEWLTGVGLWSKARNMYHYVVYPIPAGAKKFTAELYVTDDPFGYLRNHNLSTANQQGKCDIQIDGVECFSKDYLRVTQPWGSGEKLADVDIAIPTGAKEIRFQLTASPWGDGNGNTEVVIHNGRFHK